MHQGVGSHRHQTSHPETCERECCIHDGKFSMRPWTLIACENVKECELVFVVIGGWMSHCWCQRQQNRSLVVERGRRRDVRAAGFAVVIGGWMSHCWCQCQQNRSLVVERGRRRDVRATGFAVPSQQDLRNSRKLQKQVRKVSPFAVSMRCAERRT